MPPLPKVHREQNTTSRATTGTTKPESGAGGQGDAAHLPGGGGGHPLDHYPYGGERVVSAEQTPRKGIIWSRMTTSAAAFSARLKGCALTELGAAALRARGSTVLICSLLLSVTEAELAATSVLSRTSSLNQKCRNGPAQSTTASLAGSARQRRHFS